MLIFAVDSHAAATSRITETLVGAAAGLAAGLIVAPLRVQPAKDAIGDLTRQMADLLGQMADGLATDLDPRRAAEWLDRTRALRGEIERLDDALAQAEESVRLNPRRLRFPDPAAGLRHGVDTLERAATDLRVLARSIADSARLDSEDSPVKDPKTRARLAAVITELAASVRAYGQLIETDPEPAEVAALGGSGASRSPRARGAWGAPGSSGAWGSSGSSGSSESSGASGSEPLAAELEDHLEEAQRQQDRLADVLRTDPAERPDGWQLRGEILAHVDRLRNELQPARPVPRDQDRTPLQRLRDRRRLSRSVARRRAGRAALGVRANRAALRVRAGRTAARARARRRA